MGVLSKHRDNQIVLYTRYDSPNIYCGVKDPEGKSHRKSTKATDETGALRVAEDWFVEIRVLHSHGKPVRQRTFASVASLYLKELSEEVSLGFKNERVFKDYRAIVNKYLGPFFGLHYICSLKLKDIANYNVWRAKYHISGPGSEENLVVYQLNGKTIKRKKRKTGLPSYTSRNTENVVLRAIFVTALKHEFIDTNQMPDLSMIKKITGKQTQRPFFTLEKYEELTKFLFEWHNEPKAKDKDMRWLLRNYVLFMVNTGIRPGKEADQICWKHLRKKPNTKGELEYILTIPSTTKTGDRFPSVNAVAASALTQTKMDMVMGGTDVTDDMPIFCLPNGSPVKHKSMRRTFKKALKACGMTENEKDEKYCPYSLRHTYATYQLVYNKTPTHLLSRQMGCSEKMINDHYSKLLPEMDMEQLNSVTPDTVLWDQNPIKKTI